MASLGEKIGVRERGKLFGQDLCKSSGLRIGWSRWGLMRGMHRSSNLVLRKDKSAILIFVPCTEAVPVQCCVSAFDSQCS